MAMRPDTQDVFFQLVVSGGGEFVYDASGNLRSSNVGQPTTDPIQGISCPQGFATYNGHGAVINLLSTANSAFFQYQDLDTAVQGIMILSVASTSGTDPVTGATYAAGLTGIDPVFGDFLNSTGAIINMGVGTALSQSGRIQVNQAPSNAQSPFIALYAPEENASGHLVMLMQGASPDGTTRPAQLVVASGATGFGNPAPVSKSLAEIQGTLAAGVLDAAPAATAPPARPAGTEPWNYVGSGGSQPAFGTGWSNFGGGFANLGFKLVPSPPRAVWIKGEVTHTATAAQTIFTLPAAYRPASNQQFICMTNASGVVGVEVSAAGLVELLVAPAAIVTHNIDLLVSLDV